MENPLISFSGCLNTRWNRGTQSKNVTSCGITEMTDIVSALVLLLTLRFHTEKNMLLSLRFRTEKTMLLSLRFRTEKTMLLSHRKKHVADATLSHKKHLKT